ncbi:TrkH family potassium uptake protein [Spongorhabdus nitratireducens]
MHLSLIFRVLGILLMLFSLSSLPSMLVAWIYDEPEIAIFSYTFLITLLTGFVLWTPFKNARQELRIRDGFLITVLFWTVLGCFGALPFLLMETPALSVSDSLFEAISGLTTTGATVLTDIESLPKSVLFYRQQLQWFGGMGIIVLAVAVLPLLGIGGMQLYRSETPGPIKDSKLTPRITETAKALWIIYMVLTLVCAVAYWVAGMSLFDAISHSFSTVAIGGFSTYDSSLGAFNSSLIEIIAIVFMAISGMNFALHFFAWRQKSLKHYLKDPELRVYLLMLGSVSLLTVVTLGFTDHMDWSVALRQGVFQVVSIATTTGFATDDFSSWPVFLPMLLFMTAFAGGCAGSTGGGMKIIRVLLIHKQGIRELQRMLHPNAIITIKIGNKPVDDRVGGAVWGFFAAYMGVFLVLYVAVMATGVEMMTAFSTVASCMNNLGPALGDAVANYATLPDSAKWILSFGMLLGRLEIFTLLVLFTPAFWRY